MIKYNFFLALLMCGLVWTARSQEYKYEREARIDREAFPELALQTLQPYEKSVRRMRYYRETDSVQVSFEAKFRHQGRSFSVEFGPGGRLQDVEVTMRQKELPEACAVAVKDYLDREFRRYRLKKIQRQYLPTETLDAQELLPLALQFQDVEDLNYELVLAGKKEGGYRDFELLFRADGTLLREQIFLPESYDHVLH